jgi:hypothetical protein
MISAKFAEFAYFYFVGRINFVFFGYVVFVAAFAANK